MTEFFVLFFVLCRHIKMFNSTNSTNLSFNLTCSSSRKLDSQSQSTLCCSYTYMLVLHNITQEILFFTREENQMNLGLCWPTHLEILCIFQCSCAVSADIFGLAARNDWVRDASHDVTSTNVRCTDLS